MLVHLKVYVQYQISLVLWFIQSKSGSAHKHLPEQEVESLPLLEKGWKGAKANLSECTFKNPQSLAKFDNKQCTWSI